MVKLVVFEIIIYFATSVNPRTGEFFPVIWANCFVLYSSKNVKTRLSLYDSYIKPLTMKLTMLLNQEHRLL